MIPLAKLLEAALFASPRPIPVDELAALAPEASKAEVAAALEGLREHYDVDGHGVELVELAGGWQILTRPEYTEAIERAQVSVRPQRLSAASLETLAIVAYRQPIGRAEIEEIRGVAVGSVLKSLHDRGLIDIVGRSEGLGRPMLYGTTPLFLEQFGLRHLEELPRADELAIALRGAGGLVATPLEPPPPLLPLGEGVVEATVPGEVTTATERLVEAHELATDETLTEDSAVFEDTDSETDGETDGEIEAAGMAAADGADEPFATAPEAAPFDDSPYAGDDVSRATTDPT